MWMSFTSCEWLTRCCVRVIRSLINFSVLRTLVQHHTQQLQIYGENLLGRGVMKLAWLVWLVVMTMSWILSMWSRVESGEFSCWSTKCMCIWLSVLKPGNIGWKKSVFRTCIAGSVNSRYSRGRETKEKLSCFLRHWVYAGKKCSEGQSCCSF